MEGTVSLEDLDLLVADGQFDAIHCKAFSFVPGLMVYNLGLVRECHEAELAATV